MLPALRISRVLIVDDHPAVRDGLALRIASEPDLEVCGEAGDVAEALRLAEAVAPDIAIIDISLKTGNGIDLVKRIAERIPAVRMLVWSMYNEFFYAERALRAGAMGYISKEEATSQIVSALRCIQSGKVYLSAALNEHLLQRTVGGRSRLERSPIEELSDRELEVLQQIGQGRTTLAIAEKMHISPKTVETYRRRIKEKLAVPNAAELTRLAVEWMIENG